MQVREMPPASVSSSVKRWQLAFETLWRNESGGSKHSEQYWTLDRSLGHDLTYAWHQGEGTACGEINR